jgi:riboflavin synthase
MFTGIIEELGEIKGILRQAKTARIIVKADKVLAETEIGDSISVNGTCLTVVNKENSCLVFEAVPETMKVTNLGLVRSGEKVNLERSLRMSDRVSGHFVTGHIDCLGIVRKKIYKEGNLAFEIAVPAQFTQYILPKGSIAVDGISLTVMERKSNTFTVYVIPHTFINTTFNFKGPSDKVNVEFDILAKKTANPAR